MTIMDDEIYGENVLDWDETDVEAGMTHGQLRERRIVEAISNVKADVEWLNLKIEEYYTSHWRDDDSPLAEMTFGVKRMAV